MRRIAGLALVGLLFGSTAASAQATAEPIGIGVTAAAGFPAGLTAFRVGGPLGAHAGIDFAVARLFTGGQVGPALITHVRWMRGGRKPSGRSGYWIFGVLTAHTRASTLVIWPGNVRTYMVDDHAVVMPRVGYGWDYLTRHGMRTGIELTTGAAGEEQGLALANLFVTWGPPR